MESPIRAPKVALAHATTGTQSILSSHGPPAHNWETHTCPSFFQLSRGHLQVAQLLLLHKEVKWLRSEGILICLQTCGSEETCTNKLKLHIASELSR